MQRARFDELGSIQFELMCRELLELESGFASDDWRKLDFGASALSAAGVLVPGASTTLAGPTLVVVHWRHRDAVTSNVREAVEQARREWQPAHPHSYLVLTNARFAGEVTCVGPDELTRLVAASPQLRLRVPSLLGICELDELVAPDLRSRSRADVGAAADLARVFVATRAYANALATLERHSFVVLTGPPEMGKTAIARIIGLGLLTAGWELHECTDPAQLWTLYRADRKQVFVADDAFGSTEYRPDAAERWALELDRTLRALDDSHRLVWTSRPAPLKAALRRIHREHGVERFPAPAEVQVDASRLDAAEKALILFRHAKAAALEGAGIELVRSQGWRIVSHEHFTPERIRRFASGRLRGLAREAAEPAELDRIVSAELREPTAAMAASFRALAPDHRTVLVALLDTPPGPVPERELVAAVRRHSHTTLTRAPATLVDQLTDHFLRITEPAGVDWVHPSWRDLVIDELARDRAARREFLRQCSLEGVLLALSVAGGPAGERELPLLPEDADWDEVTERLAALVAELDGPLVTRLVGTITEARLAASEQRDELDALATYVLSLLARRWRREHTIVPVGLLSVWFALASELPERPDAPEIATTWIELVPTDVPDVDDAADLAQWDEWSALAELLGEHEPGALATFGFPERHGISIATFVAEARFAAAALRTSPRRELVVQILRRFASLAPGYSNGAASVATALNWPTATEVSTPPRRAISPELLQILDATPPESERALVERVLRDL